MFASLMPQEPEPVVAARTSHGERPHGERRHAPRGPEVVPAHRHLVLMGSMGSGKTTVGRLAAAKLDRPFFDSDDDLASMFGATASEIEERHGIEQLHEVEADLLHRRLCASEPSVIAAAASTIEVPRCRRLLRSRAQVAWLYVEPDVVAHRIAASSWRPLVHDWSEE